MQQEVVFESQQPSLHNFSTLEFNLTNDQFIYIQTIIPKTYSLQETKKKKQRKDPILGQLESQSQSIQGARNSMRRPQSKDPASKRLQTKKIYQQETVPKIKNIPPIVAVATLSPQQTTYYQSILGQVKKHQNAFPFMKPVDPIALQIPDYFEVIKHPMDLSTIQKKLKQKQYQTPNQFLHDLNQIWVNSYSYNPKGSDMYIMTTQIEKYTNKLLIKPPQTKEKEVVPVVIAKKPVNTKQISKPSKKSKQIPKEVIKAMTTIQKKQLKYDIQQLPSQFLGGVWEIVAKDREDMDAIIDLNSLQFEKLKKLDAYCKDITHFKKREEKKVIQNVIEAQDIISAQESSFILDSE